VYQLLQDTTAHIATDTGVMDSVDACAAVVAIAGHGACKRFSPAENRVANGGDGRVAMH
jgi:hypothetical protein